MQESLYPLDISYSKSNFLLSLVASNVQGKEKVHCSVSHLSILFIYLFINDLQIHRPLLASTNRS